MGLVVVAHALPPPTINEVRIDCHMFVTRVNMDLNIIYCENRYFVFVLISYCVLYIGEGWCLQQSEGFYSPSVAHYKS